MLTQPISSDQLYYDKGVAEEDVAPYVQDIATFFDGWANERKRWFEGRDDVRVLELGAGSCAMSLMASLEPWSGEIVAGDISVARMEQIRPQAQAMFGGKLEKIRLTEIDINEPLSFPDQHFDLVMMDGTLHHSRAIWFTVSEIHRVLKSQGHFVAQREQFVAPLTSRIKLKRLLATDEVMNGVSENAYLKEQYEYYLRANGFDVRFLPVLPSAKFKALGFLNGLAFSKYNIVATKVNEVARPVL